MPYGPSATRGGAYGARRQAVAAAPTSPQDQQRYNQQREKRKQEVATLLSAKRDTANFLRRTQAENTVRDINALYESSMGSEYAANNQTIADARRQYLGELANINTGGRIARSERDVALQMLGIDQGVNQGQLADIATKLGLNNEQFGLAMRQTQGSLANQDIIDQFLNQTRGQDVTDITEAKRKADLGTSIQMGETAGMASGAARLGLFANTKEEQSAQARSEQALQEGLAKSAFTRKQLNWDLEAAGLSRREKEIELKATERALNAEAKKAGLSRRQYELELQKKLNELNLNKVVSIGQWAKAANAGIATGIGIGKDVIRASSQNPETVKALGVIARGGRRAGVR